MAMASSGRVELVEVRQHPGDARADHAGHDHAHGEAVGGVAGDAVLLAVAGRQPGADEHADRDHQPEGAQRQRPELDLGEGRVGDRRQHARACVPALERLVPAARRDDARVSATLGPQVPRW